MLLAADSCSSDQWVQTRRTEPKVFQVGGYGVGFTTSFRMGDILRYATLPQWDGRADLHEHLVTQVIPAIRSAMTDAGWMVTREGRQEGGAFLLAAGGRLFEVANDFQVGRPREGYAAVGGGYAVALGALHAMKQRDQQMCAPRACARAAMRAARDHAIHIRPPWRYLWMPAR